MRPMLLILTACFFLVPTPSHAREPIFAPVRIDGPKHDPPNHSYWFGPFCECASVADLDGDGDLDLISGRNWYEAPDWRKHENFRDGAETNGPETDDNSEFAMDVNKDGRPDIVASGWMKVKGAFWYENPGPEGLKNEKKWTGRRIHRAFSMEGVVHGDIDGDGDDDILVNHWSLVPGQGMTWIESIDQEPWLVEHVIGTEGEKHGNGLGDVNGDGRMDIVTPLGWYEGPRQANQDKWNFHADYEFKVEQYGGSAASHPILVHDINRDGLNDILIGAAHTYGLAWLQQSVDRTGRRSFKQHWIESDYGQFHTMALGDLNGDGQADLVTGKRLFAHHGRDVSWDEPLFAFWYDIQGGKFQRHILSFNHLPWYSAEENHNPPPVGAIAVGMKVLIVDLDQDGDNDIVSPGKTGLHVFYNQGMAPRAQQPSRLLLEKTFPSWIEWTNQ